MTAPTDAKLAAHDAIAAAYEMHGLPHLWLDRSTFNKARMVLRESARRLEGMATVLYALARDNARRDGLIFVANSASDMARVLAAMHALVKADDDAADAAAVAAADDVGEDEDEAAEVDQPPETPPPDPATRCVPRMG